MKPRGLEVLAVNFDERRRDGVALAGPGGRDGNTPGDTWPVCVPTNGEPHFGDFGAERWRWS
jgi:hypothetical protein